jgi:hypothetical protein
MCPASLTDSFCSIIHGIVPILCSTIAAPCGLQRLDAERHIALRRLGLVHNQVVHPILHPLLGVPTYIRSILVVQNTASTLLVEVLYHLYQHGVPFILSWRSTRPLFRNAFLTLHLCIQWCSVAAPWRVTWTNE